VVLDAEVDLGNIDIFLATDRGSSRIQITPPVPPEPLG
jgi:hypothetical protein